MEVKPTDEEVTMVDVTDGDTNMMTSLSPLTTAMPCYFLSSIPLEIRLEIYRYLLLPIRAIEAAPPRRKVEKEGSENSSEEDWTDDTEDYSEYGSLSSEMMDDDFDAIFDGFSDDTSDSEDHEVDFERSMAILRINRQINSEASALFYSEAIMTLDPGDILCLAKNPHKLDLGRPNEMAWKHNPLQGIGKEHTTGVVSYNTHPLEGDLEPHILARFQRILFDAHFDEEDTRRMEFWIDDDTHVLGKADAVRFQTALDSSPVFKYLTKILSNSHRITRLDVLLEVEVCATSTLILQDDESLDNLDDEESNDDEEEERMMKIDRIEQIANFRATELMVESKFMKPLLKLNNVVSCSFDFGFDYLDDDVPYKPPVKYAKLLQRMKTKIESNFQERHI